MEENEIAPIMFVYATFFSLMEFGGVFGFIRLLMTLLDRERKVSLWSGVVLVVIMLYLLVFLAWGIYQQWRALGESIEWTLFFGIFSWGIGIIAGVVFWKDYKKRLDYF